METTFGSAIRQARKTKGYSQKQLAEQIGLDFTYLSKIENERFEYPPKEKVIKAIAHNLDLDSKQLIFLAGRIPEKDSELLRRYYQTMAALFRRIREDSQFIHKLSQQISLQKD